MGVRNQSTKTQRTSTIVSGLFKLSVFRVNLNTFMCMSKARVDRLMILAIESRYIVHFDCPSLYVGDSSEIYFFGVNINVGNEGN